MKEFQILKLIVNLIKNLLLKNIIKTLKYFAFKSTTLQTLKDLSLLDK